MLNPHLSLDGSLDRFLACTEGHSYLAFYSGLACRLADLLFALFRWSLFPEGLQFLWAIFKSVSFAFHATGLDAVQRLEQKKIVSC